MRPTLSQNQQQRQLLSPQIRQYLKLLQLPIAELTQAIEAEMEENPVLEDIVQSSAETDPLPEGPDPSQEQEKELEFNEAKTESDKLEEEFDDLGYEQDLAAQNPHEAQAKKDFRESLISHQDSLYDYLNRQIQILDLDEKGKKIAEQIIGNLNEDGYLRATLDEIATAGQSSISDVERVLAQIQKLDPPGIAARTLEESLMLQLERKGEGASLARAIIHQHLPELKRKDWHTIAKAKDVSENEVRKAARLISSLDPKPGQSCVAEASPAVIPDATVSFNESGHPKFKIEIHDEIIPELRISPYYRKLLRQHRGDPKTTAFLKEKIQRAMNFIKALHLRKSTLREITEEIVSAQEAFFEKGFAHLAPLRLKDVAREIGVHESTVSRTIQNKYIVTPQGTVPYKSFFSTRLESSSGEAESQKSMMEKVRKLIEGEDPKHPLSDQEIASHFASEGLRIARRTIAKYREMLKILPSHIRKEK
ncbi:MAG: RNA polymerase factor sigma-54 [Candidatus Omnitrophota bacterium]